MLREKGGNVFNLTLHPWVTGGPHRIPLTCARRCTGILDPSRMCGAHDDGRDSRRRRSGRRC